MPGTRDRTSRANNDGKTEPDSESNGGPPIKRLKPNADGGKTVLTPSSSSPPVTPKRSRRGVAATFGNDLTGRKSETKSGKKPEKSPPVTAQGKARQPKKGEDGGSVEKGDPEKVASGIATSGGGSKAKADQETSGVFSPRRSGRGVVPNSRFKDMELDLAAIGKKRPKEKTTETSNQKRSRTTAKKEEGGKGQQSPVKRSAKASVAKDASKKNTNISVSPDSVNEISSSLTSEKPLASMISDKVSFQQTSIALPQKTLVSSSECSSETLASTETVQFTSAHGDPSSKSSVSSYEVSNTSKSALFHQSATSITSVPQLEMSTVSTFSPESSVSQTSISPSVVPAEISSESSATPSQLTTASTLHFTPSAKGKTTPSKTPSSPRALVSPPAKSFAAVSQLPAALVPSLVTSSTTAVRTVSITSSRALLARSGPPANDSVISDIAEDKKTVLPVHDSTVPMELADFHSADTGISAGVAASDDSGASELPGVLGLTPDTSVVEVSVVSGSKSPRVVSISPLSTSLTVEKGKTAVETPGRVVGKSSSDLASTSKSVYIVRNPANQIISTQGEIMSNKPHVLPVVSDGTPSSKITTVTKEAGVGEVMSIVEVSPNKKVPVVLAERKEHTGKVVKVISAQQIHQLPAAMQKIVLSQLAQQKSSKSGSSQASVLLAQDSDKKSLDVHETPSSSNLVTTGGSGPSKKSDLSEDSTAGQPGKDGSTAGHFSNSEQDESIEKSDGIQVHLSKESDMTDKVLGASPSSHAPAEEHVNEEAGTTAGIPETGVTDQTPETSGESQSVAQVTSLSKQTSDSSLSDDSEETEEQDEEEEEGIPVSGKYVTSGTQTPYSKRATKKVITVHVHPPPKEGEQNREVVTVTKVDKDDTADDSIEADEKEDEHAGDTKWKYIVVDLPEGSTVKQHYVRSNERLDADPNFYALDDQGMFTCQICQYQTYRRANFYKHKKKHLGVRPYACDQCPYRAATSSNLKRHQEIHKDIRNHKCPMCDLFFRQKIHLERHIKYRHEEKKVKCPLCDYVCANENPDLKVHIKRRHIPQTGSQETINAFKCAECGVVASSKRDLRQHLKFHSKGPELKLFCNMCSFVTDCESRLRRHQYIHTKEKPFQCGLCDYRGSQKEHVLRHMRTQHNIEVARKLRAKKIGPDKSSEEGSKAVEKADYTSEEKIFACNHCSMKFSKLINLYKHLHTQHRDIMPPEQEDFSCVVCDFRTSNKKNLLVHMRRHNVTDQSPPSHVYSCVLCRYMNPKRRNLFQHMRKKHHIEIVMREDGSTTCYVANETIISAASNGGVGSSHSLLSQQTAHSSDSMVNVLPITDLISTVAQPTDLQVTTDSTSSSNNSAAVATTIKMEDLALVVSNPQTTHVPAAREGEATLVEAGTMDSFTIEAFSQDDAAEAIQGLQALAQRGVLETGAIIEEQVQVMGSDEQATLVIDPTSLGVMEQLVQPKTEALEVVEIDNPQLLDQVASTSILPDQEAIMLANTSTAHEATAEGSGLQLSAEQLMNLSTGDYLEINGEMFKVEVSTDGAQGQQIISFEPATASVPQESGEDSLEQSEVSLESAELS